MSKQQKSLIEILEKYETIALDIEQAIERTGSVRDLDFQVKELQKNNKELETNIQGSGTGKD